jgi:hypothetical protein
VQQTLDAASYRSAIDNLSRGNGVVTNVGASFSSFEPSAFVDRGGEIPFTDFALGYPLVATMPAVLVGASAGIVAVQVLATAVVGGVVAAMSLRLARSTRSSTVGDMRMLWFTLVAGLGSVALVLWSPMLLTIRGGLSEPLFCACALVSAAAAVEALRGGRGVGLSVGAASLASLVRFVGAPLLLVPLVIAWHCVGRRRTVLWGVAAVAPTLVNIVWASSVAAQSRLGVRSIAADDVRFAARSVGGWVWRPLGEFEGLVADRSWPPLWVWPLIALWLGGAIVSVRWCLQHRTDRAAIAVPMAMAATLLIGLAAGMMLFDSLVTADSRLMLPIGVLTAAAVLWHTAATVQRTRAVRCAGVAVLAWLVLCADPGQLRNPAPDSSAATLADGMRAAVGDSGVVVSNAADQVWWQLGVPAMYLPGPVDLLTGAPRDVRAQYDDLLCAMQRRAADRLDTVILVVPAAFASDDAPLFELLAEGRLVATTHGPVTSYRLAADAAPCASPITDS